MHAAQTKLLYSSIVGRKLSLFLGKASVLFVHAWGAEKLEHAARDEELCGSRRPHASRVNVRFFLREAKRSKSSYKSISTGSRNNLCVPSYIP